MKMQTKRLFGILAVVVGMVFWAGCALEDDETSGGTTGGGGGGGGMPRITIQNNTGMSIDLSQIKLSSSTDWTNIHRFNNHNDGASWTHTFSQPLPANSRFDIRLRSGNITFVRYRVSLSNGTTVRFTDNDFTDERYLPRITVLNRTGTSLNNLLIKPSSVNDWGNSFGSISSNSFRTETISIPPSSYTVFDIQVSSTSPATTYTMRNVTVSDGTSLMFTRANADTQPLSGMPTIVVQNNTGMPIGRSQIKPSSTTDWNNIHGGFNYADGASWTHTFSQPLSVNNRFDIRLSSGSQVFTRSNITVTDGMLIPFTMSHLD